jgi:hypothetical protein
MKLSHELLVYLRPKWPMYFPKEFRELSENEVSVYQSIMDLLIKYQGSTTEFMKTILSRDCGVDMNLAEVGGILGNLEEMGFVSGDFSGPNLIYTVLNRRDKHKTMLSFWNQANLEHKQDEEFERREREIHESQLKAANALDEIAAMKKRQEVSEAKQENINKRNRSFQIWATIFGTIILSAQVIVAVIALPSKTDDKERQQLEGQARREVDSLSKTVEHPSSSMPDSSYPKDTLAR